MSDGIEHVHLDDFAARDPELAALLDAAARNGRRLTYHGRVLEIETPAVLRSARWIATATAGRYAPGISREMLKNRRQRGQFPGAVRRGQFWFYPLDQVCRVTTWSDYAPQIRRALRAEQSDSEHIGTLRA